MSEVARNETVKKVMAFHRSFNQMSKDERSKWALDMGEIRVEDFFRANQSVFDEDGPAERNLEKRSFFLELLQKQVVSPPLEFERGHPVSNYLEENIIIRHICTQASEALQRGDEKATLKLVQELKGVHIHYLRKEDQLFPYLEKHNFTYPSVGMWKFHDELRDRLKNATMYLARGEAQKQELLDVLQDIYEMSIREERMLLPTAVYLLSKAEWLKIAKEEREIGYAFIEEPPHYGATSSVGVHNPFGSIALHDGSLTQEQLEMIFTYMPFDVTIVDENDRVAFFNKGDKRTFLRSAGVIGREVRFCHPPKSVHTVLEILEAFKDGSRDDAEFWINFKGRLTHIRYFALRDAKRNYKGVMEITQDITDIQKLSGERRLLEWQ
ncbi:MAG: PAS domain-containing protein [Sulfuricurvum sp.]